MGRPFNREQSPMLTVEHDYDSPNYDKCNADARAYAANHNVKRVRQKSACFVRNPKWKRCFTGLDNRKKRV